LLSSSSTNKEDIGSLLVSSSEYLGANYIIIGSRGLGRIRQFFMGSVSKYVVEHAHCPVLVVKDSE